MPITYQKLGNSGGVIKAHIKFDVQDMGANSNASMAFGMTELPYDGGEYVLVGVSTFDADNSSVANAGGHILTLKYGLWYFDFVFDKEFSKMSNKIAITISGVKFDSITSNSIPDKAKIQCDVYLMKV